MAPGELVRGTATCIGRNVIINFIRRTRWSKAALPYHACFLIMDNPRVGMKPGQGSHYAPAVDRQTDRQDGTQTVGSSHLVLWNSTCSRGPGSTATSPSSSPLAPLLKLGCVTSHYKRCHFGSTGASHLHQGHLADAFIHSDFQRFIQTFTAESTTQYLTAGSS